MVDPLGVTVSPIAILRRVRAVYFPPLNRKSRIGFQSHVFQELNETLAPSRTNSDSSSAVQRIVLSALVVATVLDIGPTGVFGSRARRCLSAVLRLAD